VVAPRLRALAEWWTAVRRRLPIDRDRALAGLLVAAGAVVAAVVGALVFPFHSVNHDEGVYLAQAAMLLEGQLFLDPPAAELFRPWFFVERPDGRLYPKYAPVPAATFALGWLVGSPRLGLVGVTAGVVLLTYALAAALFDRRVGLLAATMLFVSPLFLLHAGVFLPYAPTTVWNLLFAYAYVRADRDRSRRWAAVAGVAVGIAFFARPYTAVAFAAPFVCHAVWTLRGRVRAAARDATLLGLHRPTLTRTRRSPPATGSGSANGRFWATTGRTPPHSVSERTPRSSGGSRRGGCPRVPSGRCSPSSASLDSGRRRRVGPAPTDSCSRRRSGVSSSPTSPSGGTSTYWAISRSPQTG
jgi:hypothetical protein